MLSPPSSTAIQPVHVHANGFIKSMHQWDAGGYMYLYMCTYNTIMLINSTKLRNIRVTITCTYTMYIYRIAGEFGGWVPNQHGKILADLNLAVWYRITIRTCIQYVSNGF